MASMNWRFRRSCASSMRARVAWVLDLDEPGPVIGAICRSGSERCDHVCHPLVGPEMEGITGLSEPGAYVFGISLC
jgi:hypothetical protein